MKSKTKLAIACCALALIVIVHLYNLNKRQPDDLMEYIRIQNPDTEDCVKKEVFAKTDRKAFLDSIGTENDQMKAIQEKCERGLRLEPVELGNQKP